MNLPPLQLIDHTHFCLQGEVEIDPSAAIAPGVLFQAEPGSRIEIAAGVCIGAGVVLHARQGLLVIEAGVSLGAGALIVGAGRIGANACIGSSTTVLRPAIAPGEVIPPGSLLGDTSRQVTIDVVSVSAESANSTGSGGFTQSPPQSARQPTASAQSDSSHAQPNPNQQNGHQAAAASTDDVIPSAAPTPAANGQAGEERDRNDPAKDVDAKSETAPQSPSKGSHPTTSDSPVPPSAVGVKVYGQGQIDQLLSALFPHRQPLNDDES